MKDRQPHGRPKSARPHRNRHEEQESGRSDRYEGYEEFEDRRQPIMLAPDVAAVFKDPESVNSALRSLIRIASVMGRGRPSRFEHGKGHRHGGEQRQDFTPRQGTRSRFRKRGPGGDRG